MRIGFVEGTSRPFKRTVRWTLLILAWAVVVTLIGYIVWMAPWVLLIPVGLLIIDAASEFITWVLTDDDPG